jgi:adenylosuccinate synthase
LLHAEIVATGLERNRLVIDPNAVIVTKRDQEVEIASDLRSRIGSTCSGTGAAVIKRIARGPEVALAGSEPSMAPYLGSASAYLREALDRGRRALIEGTQGFGLSLLHSGHYPNVTTRDTTAAGALSEAGLSPRDVDQVVLVLRTVPIRVAGNSGSFDSEEIDWRTVSEEGGHSHQLSEYTSVTHQLRRVARFDAGIVRRAIECNQPSAIVLNHLDYIDAHATDGTLTDRCVDFVEDVSREIGRRIDLVGLGPDVVTPYGNKHMLAA